MSKFWRVVLVVVCLAVVSSVAGGWYLWRWLHTDLPINNLASSSRVFEVSPGDSLSRVLRRFEDRFGLRYRNVVKWYARFADLQTIRHGEYEFPENISPHGLLVLMNEGRVVQHAITLIEGSTVQQALQTIQSHPLLTPVIAELTEEELAARLGVRNGSLEGRLFPDTYYFTKGSSDWALVERAFQRSVSVLEQEWLRRADGLPYETAYEALIMASIIEKETGVVHERQTIAGVFVRRLQLGMRLQTDPTVIYGLGAEFDGNLTRAHLRQITPYNTYRISGLPPTPIALPGREAIFAALHPAQGDSLYFVARGDGSHQFSSSLEEHEEAVERYQKNRVDGYRSSPVQK